MSEATELNLGIVPKKTDECKPCNPCSEPATTEEIFPELAFEGEHADLFNEKYGPFQTNDELTLTIRTKIKKFSMGPERWDKCIKLSAVAIIGDVIEEEGEAEDGPGDEKEPAPTRKLGKKADMAEKY